MIVREQISESLVRTYSDSNFLIRGGHPESNYEEAIDPVDSGRTYTETDIPIVKVVTDEEYAEAGKILMGVIE